MNDWPWQVELDPPPDPLTVFRHLAHTPFALFLDSALVTRRDQQTTGVHPATRVSPLGRYSFITAFPFATLIIQDGQSQYTQASAGLAAISAADPFVLLQQRWRSFARQPQPIRADLPPFQGGVAGCWGYELAHRLERIPHGAGLEARPDANLPDMALGFYDWALAWDHADPGGARCWLFANGWPAAEPAARQRRAQERIEQILALIGRPAPPLPPWTVSPGTAADDQRRSAPRFSVPGHANLTSTFSRPAYLTAVRRVLAHIRAGDVYQVNLTQRLHLVLAAHPWEHYLRLRQLNPAPFAAYFVLPSAGAAAPGAVGGAILSASPERFLRVQQGCEETRPIKGTRPRGNTPAADADLAAALAASAKDQAENVMIVDLLRNDLSKVCRPFSVQTPELFTVETYATVHHLVSTVVGQLRPELNAVDLLRACFPGGSITGAPKVRAMQIIASLEPTPRGIYCGSLGYLGFDGAFDSSIAIRTAVAGASELSFGVGGGIVADSDPAAEYAETLHKAAGLLTGLTWPGEDRT